MTQKAKPEFTDYGIALGKIGDNCENIIKSLHSGAIHYVADANTIEAAKHLLPKDAIILELSGTPKADDKTVAKIREETANAVALIAVGSGTINDLCKYASYLDGKPYSVIATAPSMNGYVSANASITIDGYKSTLPAHAPTATICDIDILSAAPKRLIQAGIGDILCRSTVQADWLLSHLLFGTEYALEYFDWLADSENALIQDTSDTKALIEALLLSGLAMRGFGSSAPASQGEHMIAHTMEMLFPTLPHSYHGEQIAVTSLSMAKQQEKLLQQESVQIADIEAFANLPLSLHKQASEQFYKKLPDVDTVERLNAKLANKWPDIAKQISKVILPASQLEYSLKAAGCPTLPQYIKWPTEDYAQATQLARFTRDRFTFLDIA